MLNFGWATVKQGDRVAVWNDRGEVAYVDGPRFLFLVNRRVEPLASHVAQPGQYLVVRFRDGRVEHVPGPAALFFDPVAHAAVETRDALPVSSHEALVVYRRDGDAVGRRVVAGPRSFVPSADEWLHGFSWHGSRDGSVKKVPHALRFTKLRVIPDQMYHDVEDVRTADDALLLVKLMIFFELVDIERMLDRTHDPVADFINAVTADVIDFTAGLAFERFKENTERLNDLATYRNLVQNAARIGYRVTKVVYRGYQAGAKLQKMHDGAIEARTELVLAAETETQAQALEDMKQAREAERARLRQEIERADQAHRLDLETRERSARRAMAEADLAAELDAAARRREAELAGEAAANGERSRYLDTLKALEVDVTRYLVAQYQHPDRLVRVEGCPPPEVHVHD